MKHLHETLDDSIQQASPTYDRLAADEWRRMVVDVLGEQPAISLDGLAETVVERADDPTDIKAVKVELHHRHLPLLEDGGVLTYDRRRHHVTAVEPERSARTSLSSRIVGRLTAADLPGARLGGDGGG